MALIPRQIAASEQFWRAHEVAPIDKLSVVLVAVIFLGEKLAPHSWLGVALIGGGAILVAIQ